MNPFAYDPFRVVSPHGRIVAATAAGAILIGLGIACFLEPDPRDHGTHQQLGFPPCTMVALFGIRCPTCGMTTAWANTVRGRLIAAMTANVGGTLLALAAIGSVAGLSVTAWSGRRPVRFPGRDGFARGGVAIAAITLTDWAIRILWS